MHPTCMYLYTTHAKNLFGGAISLDSLLLLLLLVLFYEELRWKVIFLAQLSSKNTIIYIYFFIASYTTWTKLLMFAHIACIKTSNHESLCGDFLIFPIVLSLTLGLGTTLHQYTTDVGIERGIIWGVGIHDTYNNVPFLRCLQIKRLLRILTPNVPWGHLSPNDEFSKCGRGCKWHHYFP